MSRAIHVERAGRVTIITMDRQHVRNALDARSQAELSEAFDRFAADDDQWVAILTGAGPVAFCAGHDLGTPAPQGPDEMPRGGFGGLFMTMAGIGLVARAGANESLGSLAHGKGFSVDRTIRIRDSSGKC